MIDGLLRLFGIGRTEGPYPPSSSALAALFGSEKVAAGEQVDEYRALNYSAYWFGVRLIAEAVASLPCSLYRRLPDGGKEKADDEDLHWLLHDDWNEETASFMGREALGAHLLTYGNGYAEIERDNAGKPLALIQLLPCHVYPDRDKQGRLVYRLTGDSSNVPVPADRMLHVPGLGFDGLMGYSPVRMARQSIGLGLAQERFAATLFGNNAKPAGMLTHPGEPPKAKRDEFRRGWTEEHGGANSNRVAIVWGGWTYQGVGIPPEEAQFLESRAFSREEIGLWLNIPPFKLGVSKAATYASVEQFAIDFVVHTIRPWLIRWEAEYRRKLIPKDRRRELFVEHLVDALLRGDVTSRTAALVQQFNNGAVNQDEWREIENRNPLPDGLGQRYYRPANLTPVDAPDVQQEPTQEPAPPPLPGSINGRIGH